MRGPPDARGRQQRRPDEPRVEPTFSRRAVLQAGAVGVATLAGVTVLDSTAADSPVSADTALPVGDHELNQGWLFGGVYRPGAERPDFPETSFAEVALPHTVVPLSWGDWDDASWEQLWIYRKHLSHAALSGGRAFLDFDGVMSDATVYLNGTAIGSHQGGYLPFSVELTDDLVAGDNVVAVLVDGRWLNVPPDVVSLTPEAVDYLQPAGIYRDVTLRIVPQTFIVDVFAKPVDVLTDPSVEVQLTIDPASDPGQPLAISAALLDGSTQIASTTGTAVATTGETVATVSIGGLPAITLWSPENPKLYQVSATVTHGDVSHTTVVNIGFRDARFTTAGFFLNGQRYEIFGLNRHQLFPYTGMAAPARLQRRDAELLCTELHCNMVRCSHYPQSPDFLDACDELGLMVWEEPPGWRAVGDAAFQALVLRNVHDMIVRDRNRPSVIVWATRLDEMSSQRGQVLSARARQLAETLDGTRQTTGAMATQSTVGWDEDVFAYDDYQSVDGEHTEATLSPPLPGVPYLVSEAVGARDGAPLYRWVDSEATLALQATMHAQVHNIAQGNTAYAGLLGWAGIDYASLHHADRIWHNLKWPGVLDTFRVPKPGAAFYRSQADPALGPVILPVFFWDFGSGSPPDGPGPGAMIATNCDQLDVSVGGTPIVTGASPASETFPYLGYPPVLVDLPTLSAAAGDLQIDGYVSGQWVATVRMSADTSRDQLGLVLDDNAIAGDGSDMTRLTIRALDAYGNQRPYPAGDVTLALDGPATLIVENPFPLAELGGVGGGFIRSVASRSGVVTVTATHPTLGQATSQLTVVPATVTDVGPPSSGPQPLSAVPAAAPSQPAAAAGGGAAHHRSHLRGRVRTALAAVLSAHDRHARIERLLHHDGCTVAFQAPSAGHLVIGWYAERRHRGRHHRSRWVLVAAASVSIGRAGRVRVPIRLTAPGRSLLARVRHERIVVSVSFAPATGETERSERVVELHH